jgi:phage/plasmid-like protein (TIGR03299 family)
MSLSNIIRRNGQETQWTQNLSETSETSQKLYRGVGAAINAVVSENDIDGLLSLSKLDWEVHTTDGIKFGENYQFQSDRDRVVYRNNPDKPGEVIHLDTVSPRWKPFQNRDIVRSFVTFCEKSQLVMERLGFLDQGRTVFCVAQTNESFTLAGGDVVEGKLLFTNSHQSGRGAKVDLMAPRMVCTNQMVLPVRLAGQVISHTSAYSSARVMLVLEEAKTGFEKFKEDAEFLASTPVKDEEAHALIIKILGDKDKSLDDQPRAVQQVLELYQGKAKGSEMLSAYHTAWGLAQAITEYQSHHSTQRGGNAGHINSLWLGSKRNKTEQALKQIVSAFR